MRPMRFRTFVAATLAAIAIAVPAVRVDAASDLGSCSLRPSEGDGPENLSAMLESVDAVSPNDVWAVGSRMEGSAGSPWAEHWDGTTWTPADLPHPEGPVSMSALYDVKAFASNDVWAVGTWTGDLPLVEHWDGHAWSMVKVPQMVGTERILTSVDGTGPDDLWVVGQRRDQFQERGVVLHRTGAGWQVVPAPEDAAVLQGVTMVNGAPAVAGWSIDADGYARGLVATAPLNGVWTRVDLGPPRGENTFLLSLSQDPSGSVWAVGFSNDSPDNDTVRIFRRTGTTWTEVSVAPFGGPARLLDVASDAAGSIAVGQTVTNGASHALVLRAGGGGWTVMPSESGTDAPDTLTGTTLLGGDAWAVGRTVVAGATYGIPAARVYSCG